MPKHPMPEQKPDERNKNFSEVALGYDEETAVAEAIRCIECGKCIPGCPVNIDIPGFIHEIKERNFSKACEILKQENNLPAICGRVCPQESQCEKECVLGINDEPVAIGRLERFAARYGKYNVENPKANNQKVAVVGSGPAGLTCAADLAKAGIQVKIYEALHKPGGVLEYGIPPFRLPRDILEKEIRYVEKLGVEIKTNQVVGLSPTIEELQRQYDAIFISTGAGLPYFMGLPGEMLNGVYSANEFLLRVNMMNAEDFPKSDTPVKTGENIVIIGGGNVAMDCARTAKRLGANTTIIYRRTEKEMPARDEEIEHAKEEGIEFKILTNPVKFMGEEKLEKVELIKMKLGEADDSGRQRPVPIQESNFEIEVDTAIIAIGQGPNPLLLDRIAGLDLTERGRIRINENLETSIKGIYAGGDIASRDATVISAMAQGKKAAKNIKEKLLNNV